MYRPFFNRSWRILGLLIGLLGGLALPRVVSAQTVPKLNNQELATLNNRLRHAIESFGAERFEEARIDFLEVYQRKQDPRLLFNLGSCYRRLEQSEKAIEYYELFIQSVPQSPLLPEARAYVAELRAKLDASKSAADRDQNEVKLRIAEQRAKEAESIAKANEDARRTAEAELLKKDRPKPIYKRPWFWIVVGGTAAAALGVGLGVGLWQRSKYPPEPSSDLAPQPVRF